MRYNNVELQVLIKGRSINEYPHNGRVYIEGRSGSAFEVKVTNHNPFRVEAVISVDGLSVTDGKEAGPNSSGYVLNANESTVIPGWKLSDAQVAAFEFAGKGDSYAGHASGTTRNTGVIGVMVFKDRYAANQGCYITNHQVLRGGFAGAFGPLTYQTTADDSYGALLRSVSQCSSSHYDKSALVGGACLNAVSGPGGNGIGDMGWASAIGMADMGSVNINAMSCGAVSMQSSADGTRSRRIQAKGAVAEPVVQQNLGTAFGQAQDFATTTVNFTRGDMVCTQILYYDDARGLRQRGVVIDRRSKRASSDMPNAFPGAGCAPPPGWRG